MNRNKTILLVLTIITLCGGCTNTRYLTDATSIERQHDMRAHRTGRNVGDVGINIALMFASVVFEMPAQTYSRDRSFKRISVVNQSADTLYVNMVTDILWKEKGYCDVMGIVLPPGAKQKLLVPYPAAYNVYYQSPYMEEKKLEVRTDHKLRKINLKTGLTIVQP